MMRCWFNWRWTHRLAWPIRHVQTCTDCGRTFTALVKFGSDARSTQPSDVIGLDLRQPRSAVAWPMEGSDGI